jgi:hypothetical protein
VTAQVSLGDLYATLRKELADLNNDPASAAPLLAASLVL